MDSQILEVPKSTTRNGVVLKTKNSQAVQFAGMFINLSEISRLEGIHVSHVSRIMSGQRTPSVDYARRIAKALNMGLEQFLYALENHVAIAKKPAKKEMANSLQIENNL